MKRLFKDIGLILTCITLFFPANMAASEVTLKYMGEQEGVYINKTLKGVIDVYNMGGKGQILYDDIVIENTGQFDINVLLRNVSNNDQSGIRLAKSDITPSSSKKEVYMYLENISSGYGQRYTIAENMQEYNFGVLAPGEKMILVIGGKANTNCSTWSQGDTLNTTMEFIFESLEIVENLAIEEIEDEAIEDPVIEKLEDETAEDLVIEHPVIEELEEETVEDLVIGHPVIEELEDETVEDTVVEDSVKEDVENEIVEDSVIEDFVTEDIENEIVKDPVIEDPVIEDVARYQGLLQLRR